MNLAHIINKYLESLGWGLTVTALTNAVENKTTWTVYDEYKQKCGFFLTSIKEDDTYELAARAIMIFCAQNERRE